MRPEERETRDISRAALVAALHPDSGQFARLVETAADRIDWPWVLERAAAHKVAALLAARVEQCELTARVGEAAATRLRKTRQEARARADVAHATLRELSARFQEARIPFLVVKGSVVAEHVYRDAAARRFYDVDIVVQPEMVEAAEALLRGEGYRLGQVEKLLGARPRGDAERRLAEKLTHEFYRRFEYEVPFVAPSAARLAVDLHWHIAPRARVRIGAHDLWRYTTAVVVADMQVMTLTPAATVIHLAVHATTCSFPGFRLLHLCDVAWAATRLGAQCEDLRAVADDWGVGAHLDRVLEMTTRTLGVPFPSQPRTALRWRPAFDWAARDAFLVDGAVAQPIPAWRRAWREMVWSIAMRCLRHNLVRSLRVRRSRLRWRWQRWRLRTGAAA